MHPEMSYYQLDPQGTNSIQIKMNISAFSVMEKAFENIICKLLAMLFPPQDINPTDS